MLYIADTHILAKYLAGILPNRLELVFKESEKGIHIIFIPTIVLAEIFYLIKRKKISLDFEQTISKIEVSKNFIIVPFNIDVLKLFSNIKEYEIHDKIIIATTKYLNGILITQDKEIINSKEVKIY